MFFCLYCLTVALGAYFKVKCSFHVVVCLCACAKYVKLTNRQMINREIVSLLSSRNKKNTSYFIRLIRAKTNYKNDNLQFKNGVSCVLGGSLFFPLVSSELTGS